MTADSSSVSTVHATLASDDDRERVVERLRTAHVEGRLTVTELEDRTALAYTSRTWGELDRVTADLPGGAARSGGAAYAGAAPPRRVAPYVPVAVLFAVWMIAIAVSGVFIPPVPLLFLVAFRLRAVRRWGPAS